MFIECLTSEEYYSNIYVVSILKANSAHPGGKLSNLHHQWVLLTGFNSGVLNSELVIHQLLEHPSVSPSGLSLGKPFKQSNKQKMVYLSYPVYFNIHETINDVYKLPPLSDWKLPKGD